MTISGSRPMNPLDVAGKLAHRGRGLDKLEERAGPVCRQIETRLAGAGRKLRLLEVGCGYGVALMQLRDRFRDRLDLAGTNREESHGDMDAMLTAASLSNVRAAAETQSIPLPAIIYCDAADGLPFDDRSFDLVVSQMCIQYIPDKILLLREAARVLRDDGIAMIHTPFHRPTIPAPYALLLEIWEQGAPLAFCDYVAGCEGHACLQLGYHSCIHLSHCKDFGSDLDLVYAMELNGVSPAWNGVKSIYRRAH
ncbi:MAG TPA: class I SAM-dependent methyltransferase [Dongiaceae bacterium]